MTLSSPEWLKVFFYRVWPFVSLDPPFGSLDLGPVEFGLMHYFCTLSGRLR